MVNKSLMELVSSKQNKAENIKKLDLSSVMEVLRQYLSHNSVHTKVAVLKWIHHLFNEIHNEVRTIIIPLTFRGLKNILVFCLDVRSRYQFVPSIIRNFIR